MKEYTSMPLYKRHMCAVQVSICSTIMCAIQVIYLGLKPTTLYTLTVLDYRKFFSGLSSASDSFYMASTRNSYSYGEGFTLLYDSL